MQLITQEEVDNLPLIQVTIFFGEAKDWDLLSVLFSELIDNREDLSSSIKFSFLKSSLRGEINNMVAHLLTEVAENYTVGWEPLAKPKRNKTKDKQLLTDVMEYLEHRYCATHSDIVHFP